MKGRPPVSESTSATTPAPKPVPKFVPQAWAFLGLSKSSFYRVMAADDTFPKPVRIAGFTRPVWRTADLEKWAAKLPSRR